MLSMFLESPMRPRSVIFFVLGSRLWPLARTTKKQSRRMAITTLATIFEFLAPAAIRFEHFIQILATARGGSYGAVVGSAVEN
ncbi:hypothetical protein SDJN02_26689 [Cucurbita argyrosperma subsp. argyrosperma]|nr:hypothetical protein SDJN02_26689 [Cucurbita argyrosperma subsp. argyrosperma]